jgi:hypothetical protein
VRQPLLRWGVLAIVIIGNGWGIKNVYQNDTPPLDRIAAVIRANSAPGDGIVLSEGGSGRWGIAYYLGPPYDALSGLDVEDWGDGRLIRSASDMSGCIGSGSSYSMEKSRRWIWMPCGVP